MCLLTPSMANYGCKTNLPLSTYMVTETPCYLRDVLYLPLGEGEKGKEDTRQRGTSRFEQNQKAEERYLTYISNLTFHLQSLVLK